MKKFLAYITVRRTIAICLTALAVWLAYAFSHPEIEKNYQNNDVFALVSTPNKAAEIKDIIRQGVDANLELPSGKPLLVYALLRRNNAKNIITLVNRGANVNQLYKTVSPLFLAALTQSDPKVYEALLKNGAKVDHVAQGGLTPLMAVVTKQSNPEIVRLLIKHGANANAISDQNKSVLQQAIEASASPEIIRALIEAGANVNYTTRDGITPALTAVMYNQPQTLQILMENGAIIKRQDLLGAIQQGGKPEVIKIMSQDFAGLNEVDAQNTSPIFLALITENANPDTLRALIANGADVNLANQKLRTPLMAAVIRSNEPLTLRKMTKKGIYYNIDEMPIEIRGETRKTIAQRLRVNMELVEILLEAGADPNRQDNKGKTALMYARQTGKEKKLIQLLEQYGADKKIKDYSGKDANWYANEWETLKREGYEAYADQKQKSFK